MTHRSPIFVSLLLLFSTAVAQSEKGVDIARVPGRYGGALTGMLGTNPKSFNPLLLVDSVSGEATDPLFDALLRRNPCTLQWENRLALPPQISADGLVWTVRLRPDLLWSDGQPLTAADVVFTLDVIFDEKVGSVRRDLRMVEVGDANDGKLEPLQYIANWTSALWNFVSPRPRPWRAKS